MDQPDIDCTSVPERLAPAEVARRAKLLAKDRLAMGMLEACPGPSFILNDRRQILAANRAFLVLSGASSIEELLGKRSGDAIGCREAETAPDGCGSGDACRLCGAGRGLARIEAGEEGPISEECILTRRTAHGDEALELHAGLNPIPGGLTAVVLQDISDQKRRRVLERCFFHDVLNTVGGLQSLAGLAASGDATAMEHLEEVAGTLVDEIRSQQSLSSAESGELQTHPERLDVPALCAEVARTHARDPAAAGLRIAVRASACHVIADRVLLRRVIVNLVKNAIEASCTGAVSVTVRSERGRVLIAVANPGEMPPEVQTQIFRRSFTTKAQPGRGVGTWSVKLLTEAYLGGEVAFTSTGGITEFRVLLPAA